MRLRNKTAADSGSVAPTGSCHEPRGCDPNDVAHRHLARVKPPSIERLELENARQHKVDVSVDATRQRVDLPAGLVGGVASNVVVAAANREQDYAIRMVAWFSCIKRIIQRVESPVRS